MSSSIIPSVVTATVTETIKASASATSTLRAAPQGGILEGLNPVTYQSSNPIILFIIQAAVIIIFCRILHYPLSRLRQPRVIAEVIGGIILGPSAMMRIPGFKESIFPKESMPLLSLVANLGLILFLFLVALEVDMRMFYQNWRVALSVGLAGMAIPFGLGCAIAYGLYHEFRTDEGITPISFGIYALFIGTALSITAFPVLCRILSELKLLGTSVGVTVLAAGVGNDVTGWVLLALCVALVNQGSGLTALWVLLCCVAWILFLVYAIRPCFLYMLRRSGSLTNGPTQSMVMVTLLLVLTSAWFTGVIGVHPIFGAFLAGLICPHEGGFAIKLTEKIEDLVTVLFLPLYFALSGLSTNLGLLNDGITWAYVIGVITIAFAGKIIGGTLAARANKLVWRESLTIGVLMSCKGLVELIVLNIGLQAKILSTRTFTIFVVMALVTTVSTTPLTSLLYPPWYQKKLEAWKRGEIDWEGNSLISDDGAVASAEKLQNTQVRRLLVYLRLESLPSLFTFIALMGGDASITVNKIHKTKTAALATLEESTETGPESAITIPKRPLEVHGVRLVELTERTSSVMQVSEVDEYTNRDAVVNTFKTFAQLNNVAVSGAVSVVPESSFADTLNGQASDHHSDLVLIPWSESGSMSEGDQNYQTSHQDRFSSGTHAAFITQALQSATCNVAIFVNRGFGGPARSDAPPRPIKRMLSSLSMRSNREAATAPIADRSHHVYFPFFGGADDRVALRFVLQLAQNSNITVTIVHFITPVVGTEVGKTPEVTNESMNRGSSRPGTSSQQSASPVNSQDSSNNMERDTALLHTLRDTLPTNLANRVVFVEVHTSNPLADCLDYAKEELGQSPRNAGDLVVLGRGKNLHFASESSSSPSSELKKTLGVISDALISSGTRYSVLVIQAGGKGLDI